MMRRFWAFLAITMTLSCFGVFSYAADEAALITEKCTITVDGEERKFISDDSVYTYREVSQLIILSSEPVHGIYIKFDKAPSQWTLSTLEASRHCGIDGFLHEFIQTKGETEFVLDFSDGTVISDIYIFGAGSLPSWVQRWERADKADIMVCPTHSDDDQLYFAGLIPWCASQGYTVQIAYLTHHNNTHDRPHELLEGLWHNGVKYYPHFSTFVDKYADSLDAALETYSNSNISRDDFINYYIDAINKYKPDVVVGHDSNGEYGHGVHILNMQVLTEAVELSAKRGDWNVAKTYIHLWEENATVFNWDIPTEFFGGKTPFEISQEGFSFHKSQHRFESLPRWLYGTESKPITKASEIRTYSPCRFGLYRSTVGEDSGIADLFENIKPKELPFIPLDSLTDAYKNGFTVPLLPMLVSINSTEESKASDDSDESSHIQDASDESSEVITQQPDKKAPFKVSLIMAVTPFAVVLIAYLIITAYKDR